MVSTSQLTFWTLEACSNGLPQNFKRYSLFTSLHKQNGSPRCCYPLHHFQSGLLQVLSVTFDPKLNWRAHTNRVTAKVIRWTQQLWRLAKTTGGLPPARAWQLYNTVAIPALIYTSDIWCVPPFKLAHSKNLWGSIAIMKKLHSIQGHATRFITGGLKGTTFDVLEAHTNILPINLLFYKTQLKTESWKSEEHTWERMTNTWYMKPN